MPYFLFLIILFLPCAASARDLSVAPAILFDQPAPHHKLRVRHEAPPPSDNVNLTPAVPATTPDTSTRPADAATDATPDSTNDTGNSNSDSSTAENSDTGATQAFSPHARGKADPTALVVKTIASATTDICAAAYSFTSAPIADALLAARARGVAVRLTLDKSQARGKHLMLTRLQTAGLPVRVNRHYAIMHDKFMVIDERVLQLGSFNYTRSAETKNAENVLVIRRYKKVIAAYQTECDRLWTEAVDPEALPVALPALTPPVLHSHP